MTGLASIQQGLPAEAVERQIVACLEAARDQLAEAKSFSDAKRVADYAAAVSEYVRRQIDISRAVRNDSQLLGIEAERWMGEFLLTPGSVRKRGERDQMFPKGTFAPAALDDLGVKRKAAMQYRQLVPVPPDTLRQLAASATASGREFTRKSVLRLASKMRPIEVSTNGHHAPEPDAELLDRITTGDARELAARIPDASIACCLCDPVYKQTADYEWLAAECERVLMPGGNLIAQVGNTYRFDAEVAMRRSGLEWVDLLAEVYPYGLCAHFPKRLQFGWKPYLWFSNGPRIGEWILNRTGGGGFLCAERSKELHRWGDSEKFAADLLPRLLPEGGIVWDPFSGSGVVPAVCKRLGIPFIAFEIDPDVARKGRDRVAGTAREEPAQQIFDMEAA